MKTSRDPATRGRGGLRCVSLLIAGLLLIVLVSACGKKGPLTPKLASTPRPPADVSLHQQGEVFLLAWDIPAENLDGSRADDLEGFIVRRLVYPAESGCPTCREPHDLLAEIDKDYPQPAQRVGSRLYLRDVDVAAGSGYRYAILPVTVGHATGEAALVHRTWQSPPSPPAAVEVVPGDRKVTLRWQPPTFAPGEELVGYQVYRRSGPQHAPPVPVNPEPLARPELVDLGLENGRAYEYRVSTLVRDGEVMIESVPTPGIAAVPTR